MIEENDKLVAKMRNGWQESFAKCQTSKKSNEELEYLSNEWDKEEWQWEKD